MRRAVFPGSFDPITTGHYNIVERAIPLFDEIIIALGSNSQKKYMLSEEQRLGLLETAFAGFPTVSVTKYSGLTADFCKEREAGFILRGLRNTVDFNFEQPIAQMNRSMTNVETVFIISAPEFSGVASSILRDIHRNGGDIAPFLPAGIKI